MVLEDVAQTLVCLEASRRTIVTIKPKDALHVDAMTAVLIHQGIDAADGA